MDVSSSSWNFLGRCVFRSVSSSKKLRYLVALFAVIYDLIAEEGKCGWQELEETLCGFTTLLGPSALAAGRSTGPALDRAGGVPASSAGSSAAAPAGSSNAEGPTSNREGGGQLPAPVSNGNSSPRKGQQVPALLFSGAAGAAGADHSPAASSDASSQGGAAVHGARDGRRGSSARPVHAKTTAACLTAARAIPPGFNGGVRGFSERDFANAYGRNIVRTNTAASEASSATNTSGIGAISAAVGNVSAPLAVGRTSFGPVGFAALPPVVSRAGTTAVTAGSRVVTAMPTAAAAARGAGATPATAALATAGTRVRSGTPTAQYCPFGGGGSPQWGGLSRGPVSYTRSVAWF